MSPSAARHRCLARVGQVPLAAVLPSGAAPSPMAPELRCLTDVPLNAIEWHAHRALDATEWRGSRHMRSCQEMSCHSVLPDGTQTAHSALPSGTAEPRRPGVRVPSPSRLPRPRGVFATGDVRAAGRGALRELSSVFDRAADWAGWLVPLPPEGRDGLRSVAGARDGQDGGRGLHGCLSLKGVRGRPRLPPWDLRAIVN